MSIIDEWARPLTSTELAFNDIAERKDIENYFERFWSGFDSFKLEKTDSLEYTVYLSYPEKQDRTIKVKMECRRGANFIKANQDWMYTQ